MSEDFAAMDAGNSEDDLSEEGSETGSGKYLNDIYIWSWRSNTI